MTIQPASLLLLGSVFALTLLGQIASSAHPAVDASVDDAHILLSRSPWAVQVDATMNDPADVPEISTDVPKSITQAGQPNQGNGNLDINTRWDGQIGRNRRGHLATIPVTVRWDSALVMQQAIKKIQELNPPSAKDANDNFILTVVGLLPAKAAKAAALQTSSSSDGDAGPQAKSSEEILEWFMANSALVVKGVPEMHPLNVRMESETGVVHLFFPRIQKVETGKRDILFFTRYGSMNVQAKFHLKDMQVNGKPDL